MIMDLKKNVNDLLTMMGQGQMLDAFEKYYADNVIMQENNEEPRAGKDVNRKFEQDFLASVEEMFGGEIKNIAFNEETGVAMIQSSMDVKFKGMDRMIMEEVSVQKWENGKVVHERFFYYRE